MNWRTDRSLRLDKTDNTPDKKIQRYKLVARNYESLKISKLSNL